jgi:nicotinate-nucleotide adenylyltransferase
MSSSLKTMGIIGGSFDPIHNGHLHLAHQIQVKFHLDVIRFLPCYKNPLKVNIPSASAEHRLKMLELALAGYQHFQIDDREIKAGHTNYTIETLKNIRNEMPKQSTSLGFILASDLLPQLDQWKSWETLTDYAHLIIVQRPAYPLKENLSPQLEKFLKLRESNQLEDFYKYNSGSIFIVKIEKQKPISACEIREKIAKQESIQGLVPISVEDYIKAHNLYI